MAFTRLLAVHEGRQNLGVRVHACGDVGNRVAGLDGRFGRAGHGHQARFALNQQVIGLFVAVRAITAVARDIANDDAGLLL